MEEKIELEPCPFCGGSTTSIDVRRLSPTMKGPGAIISVTLRHHCRREEGQPSGLNVSMHGRDEASAIAAWNRRSSPSRERVEGWQPFDPAVMQDLGFYIVEFADSSVGMDTWEVEEGWQQIDPDASVSWVFLLPKRAIAEAPSDG